MPLISSQSGWGVGGERVADSGSTLRSCRQAGEGGSVADTTGASFWLAAEQRHSHSSCVFGLNAIKNVDSAT